MGNNTRLRALLLATVHRDCGAAGRADPASLVDDGRAWRGAAIFVVLGVPTPPDLGQLW